MEKIDIKDLIFNSCSPASDNIICNKINEIIDWINELDNKLNTANQILEKGLKK